MKQFFKDNIYQAVRMLLNQIAMTMFSFMLIFAVSTAGEKNGASDSTNDMLLILVSLLSVLFYLFLLYHMSYEMGQKDGIRIQGKRMSYFRWKGFFIALIANSLNILLGLLEMIGKIAIEGDSLFADVSQMNPSPVWAANLYNLCHTVARFIQSMYSGLGATVFRGVGFFDLLIPLPAILVCTVFYQLGVRYSDGFIKRTPKESKKAKDSRYQ
ncbi:MAG: hypothetical protein IJX47_06745 [Clostridia bacterium]|nr:hypothetical protein [Clostridia bacterium]MBQ8382880.1 hypothetical protein [Clostridia bacterium]